jgi:hypothetical protein
LVCPDVIARFRLHPKAFTRRRELPFHRLVARMLPFRKGSTELELKCFFAALLGVVVTLAVPTRAALSKARKRLSEQVFVYLNQPSGGREDLLRRPGNAALVGLPPAGSRWDNLWFAVGMGA